MQDRGKLLGADVLGRDFQVHDVAFQRDAHLHPDAAPHPQCVEARRAHHLAHAPEQLHALGQDAEDAVLILRGAQLAVSQVLREKLQQPQQHGALLHTVAKVHVFFVLLLAEGLRVRLQHQLRFAVAGFCPAQRNTVGSIQVEAELHLRRQIRQDFLAVRLVDVDALRQGGQHVVIEIGQHIASDMHVQIRPGPVGQQRLQHPQAPGLHTAEHARHKAVACVYPVQEPRQLAVQDQAVKAAVVGLVTVQLQSDFRRLGSDLQHPLLAVRRFEAQAAVQGQLIKAVQQGPVQADALQLPAPADSGVVGLLLQHGLADQVIVSAVPLAEAVHGEVQLQAAPGAELAPVPDGLHQLFRIPEHIQLVVRPDTKTQFEGITGILEAGFQPYGQAAAPGLFPVIGAQGAVAVAGPEAVDHLPGLTVGGVPSAHAAQLLRGADHQGETVLADFHIVPVVIAPEIPAAAVDRTAQAPDPVPGKGHFRNQRTASVQRAPGHGQLAVGIRVVGIGIEQLDAVQAPRFQDALGLFVDIGIDDQVSRKAGRVVVAVAPFPRAVTGKWV